MRQFPTAAAEFWFRLQHGADKEALRQAEEFGGEEEAGQIASQLHGSLQELQSVSCESSSGPAGKIASSKQQQQLLSGKPLQASTQSSQLAHVQESMLQRLPNGRSLAVVNPRLRLGSRVTNNRRVQHSSAAYVASDSDTNDDDSMIAEDGRADSKRPFTLQLQDKDAVQNFLTRLQKPRSVLQQHRQRNPLQETQQERMVSVQQQQQTWHGKPARQTGLAAASAWPLSVVDTASIRQPSNNAEVCLPKPHPDALKQHLHRMTQDSGGGVGLSPMQSAVSTVVDRLQSVQMSLAGAEDRLALLAGKKPAMKRYKPICLGVVKFVVDKAIGNNRQDDATV